MNTINSYAANIKALCPKGARLDFQLCHVSRSRLTRDIAIFYTKESGELCELTHNVAKLLGLKVVNHGVRVSGAGMDMAWYLIRETGKAIYGDDYAFNQGYQLEGERTDARGSWIPVEGMPWSAPQVSTH